MVRSIIRSKRRTTLLFEYHVFFSTCYESAAVDPVCVLLLELADTRPAAHQQTPGRLKLLHQSLPIKCYLDAFCLFIRIFQHSTTKKNKL